MARGLLPLPPGGAAENAAGWWLLRPQRSAPRSRLPALLCCACLQSSAAYLLLAKFHTVPQLSLLQKSYDFQHRQYQEGG